MNRIFRNTIFYLLIFLVIIGIVSIFNNNNAPTDSITQDQFYKNLEEGNVQSLTMQPDNQVYKIIGQLKNQDGKLFVTYIPPSEYAQAKIGAIVEKQGIEKFEVKPAEKTSGWVTFLTSIIPFVIIFILFFFLLNQAQGGGGGSVMNFGKSKAKLYNDEKKKVRFNDVAGADEEKQSLLK